MQQEMSFPAEYEITEIDEDVTHIGRMLHGAVDFVDNSITQSNHPGLQIRCTCRNGENWVGRLFESHAEYNSCDGVYSTPSPTKVCLVYSGTAYLVDVNDPENWQQILFAPLRRVIVLPDQDLLILAGWMDICAINSSGICWQLENLVKDGLVIDTVRDNLIFGHGDGIAIENESDQFVLDLHSGQLLEKKD
ncbi:MAG: hypothetical protein JST01_01920 [Cyanobacteria bacterium SZAS TMP-1]|nr:hypothetical protein [Cyanobacteria bacterium SZAS TMP-1]